MVLHQQLATLYFFSGINHILQNYIYTLVPVNLDHPNNPFTKYSVGFYTTATVWWNYHRSEAQKKVETIIVLDWTKAHTSWTSTPQVQLCMDSSRGS